MPAYRIYFSGHVQGVGFRATAQHLARQLPQLAGRICNLLDGRVQLTVRGPAADAARLIEWLHEAFPGSIHDAKQEELPAEDDPLPVGLSGVQITRGP